MTPIRMVAVALLVGGIVLVVMGVIASDSFADNVSRTFTGHFTDKTSWYLLGGVGAAVVGAIMLVPGLGAKRA
jgi:hypothetical protein